MPTLRESGYDGSRKTPPPAIAKLGLETRPLSVAELSVLLAGEAKMWQAVAKETGMHLK